MKLHIFLSHLLEHNKYSEQPYNFGFGGPKGIPFGIVQRDFGCHLAGFERVWF